LQDKTNNIALQTKDFITCVVMVLKYFYGVRIFTDQTGRSVSIPDSPQRIISVVPSQTELLFDLGLSNEVAGITKFCVRPAEMFRTKPRVGGTKQLKPEIIRSLKPDLILANKEENEKDQIEALEAEFPVWTSDIKTFSQAKKMILAVGEITNRFFEAVGLLKKIDAAFDGLAEALHKKETCRAVYLVWNKPTMAAGGDTFISDMMGAGGFTNVLGHLRRYPEVTDDEIKAAKPEVILLSSEPFPFQQKHLSEFELRFPGVRPVCVDGELFSWYGSRLQYAPAYFLSLFEQIKTVN
jgi:ABC-type Fe3+-hydroxamate transport system substrate-binding protein